MQTRAFIVNLNVEDNPDVASIGEDVADSLRADGFNVASVHAWASPEAMSLTQPAAATLPSVLEKSQSFLQ